MFAYNLGNLWRWLVLPKRIDTWSLTTIPFERKAAVPRSRGTLPDLVSDALELAHRERTALVARTGAWRAQRGNKRLLVCLVDLKSVEVFVQEHHAGLRRIPSRRESIAAAEYVAAERPAVNYLGDTYPMGSRSRRDAAVYHHWRSTTLASSKYRQNPFAIFIWRGVRHSGRNNSELPTRMHWACAREVATLKRNRL